MDHQRKDVGDKAESGTVDGVSEQSKINKRRSFLRNSGCAALGATVIPAIGLVASPQDAYAQSFSTLSELVGRTLMRMARDIYPHDKVADKYYAGVISSYDKATDAGLKNLVNEGVSKLNAAATKRFGKSYAEVPSEGDRLVLLYAIEQTPFFQKVRNDLLYGIYNNKEIWPLFGYEGSSWEKGGYIERGYNDIDWL